MNSNMFSLLEEEDEVVKPPKQPKAPTQPKKEKAKPAPVVAAPVQDYNPSEIKTGSHSAPNPKREYGKDGKPRRDGGREGGRDGARDGAREGRDNHNSGSTYTTGRPPKREFDKHSGTGRGKETKKGGSGANNWGNTNDENENAKVADVVIGEETPAIAPTEGAPVVEKEETKVVQPEEPEDNTVTVDEYFKQQQEKKSQWNSEAFSAVEERKADTSGLEGLTIAKDEFEQFDTKKKQSSTNASNKSQRSSSKVVVAEVGFKPTPTQSDRPDRKDRKYQDKRPKNTSKSERIDVFSVKDFPSLGH